MGPAGCAFTPEAAPFTAAIDGTDGRSWHLPLEPLTSSTVEAYSPGAGQPSAGAALSLGAAPFRPAARLPCAARYL